MVFFFFFKKKKNIGHTTINVGQSSLVMCNCSCASVIHGGHFPNFIQSFKKPLPSNNFLLTTKKKPKHSTIRLLRVFARMCAKLAQQTWTFDIETNMVTPKKRTCLRPRLEGHRKMELLGFRKRHVECNEFRRRVVALNENKSETLFPPPSFWNASPGHPHQRCGTILSFDEQLMHNTSHPSIPIFIFKLHRQIALVDLRVAPIPSGNRCFRCTQTQNLKTWKNTEMDQNKTTNWLAKSAPNLEKNRNDKIPKRLVRQSK